MTADSLFGCFEWLDRLFVICSSYKIINGGIVVICKNGHAAKKYCGKLLEEELVSYIGSDCHGSKRRVTRIGDAYAYVTKKMGRQMADEIFIDNPQEILDNAKHCMTAAHR